MGVGEVRCPSRAEWDADWGKVECQALANFRDVARRLGATDAQAEDLDAYALALHT